MAMALDQILRLPLAPLLMAQGLWVRFSAMQLPEPPGPRRGGSGSGLSLLVVGDSSAAGVGADSQDRALSGRLAHEMTEPGLARWYFEAETGATTRSSLRKLDSIPVGSFDIAVLVHGVNDTTRFTSARRYRARQQDLMSRLQAAHGISHFILSGVPPMHHFPLLPQPLRWVLGCHARRLDAVLARLAEDREDCTHLALDLPYEPQFVARDGFHPSEAAYAVWAEMLAEAIRAQAARFI